MTDKKFDKSYYFGQGQGVYDDYNSFMDHQSYAQKLIKDYSFDSFLDVGCGCGNLVKEIKDILPQANIQGIDVSSFGAEKANVDYVQVASATKLPFADNSFDLVHILGTFSYLTEEEIIQSIKEALRVSKKCILFDDIYEPVSSDHHDYDPYRQNIFDQETWLAFWKNNLDHKFNYNFQINGDEILITKEFL